MSLLVWLILFGFRHAPVGIASALAETSILFAALFGIFWLRERTPSHSLGLTAIVMGAVLLRLDNWVPT